MMTTFEVCLFSSGAIVGYLLGAWTTLESVSRRVRGLGHGR